MSTACRVIEGGECEITQGYHSQHHGLDLVNKNYTCGWIVAHSAGTVVDVLNTCDYNTYPNGSVIYGNYVKIKHDDGYYTMYGHFRYQTIQVSVGQRVEQGQRLGYMGNTGYSTGAHLHWEVRDTSDTRIDPTPYLNADLPGSPAPTPTGDTYYTVNAPEGLWLLDGYKNKIRAYSYGTEVKYIGEGYDAFGYHYIGVFVTTDGAMGYMAKEYLTLVTPEPGPEPTPTTDLKVGDIVTIIAAGNTQASGNGRPNYGIGWTRKILEIYEGAAYPYRVGNESGTLGFYKAEALQKK